VRFEWPTVRRRETEIEMAKLTYSALRALAVAAALLSCGGSDQKGDDGGADGTDGASDGADGGTDGDGQSDGGSDGGADGDGDSGTDGGSDGGTDGGSDGGTDGGTGTGTDSDTDPGSDGSYSPPGYEKIWEDGFSHFDEENWTIGLMDPDTGDMPPNQGGRYLLNDNYCGYITEEDTYVEDGKLYLRNQKRSYHGTDPEGDYEYTSSWVMSMHKRYFNGSERGIYLEVRAKFPSGDKVWPAIWLIAEDLTWPPEWDLWEYFGKFFEWDYDEMYMRYIYGPWQNTENASEKIPGFDAVHDCETWHVYGFQWTATEAVWTMDGTVMNTFTRGVDIPDPDWPDKDMYIVMNNGQMTVAPDETTIWPNYLIIDYVALYAE
jgi:beta-glucanase (GH16 family)